jgi:hypothetical protein
MAAGTGGSLELVHESLIHSWPLLRRWLDETQEDSVFLEQLRNAAKQWLAKGYPQDLLWRGEAMQEAKLWHGRYRGELPELQRSYLDAVFALAARTARRRRAAVIGGFGFLSLLVIAASVALVMIRDAQQEAKAQARLVEDQLGLTKTAELRAKADRAKAVEVSQQLVTKNTALEAAIKSATAARFEAEHAQIQAEQAQTRAEEARKRAEESKRHERRSRRRATESAEDARKAAEEAKAAGARLQAMLDEERMRVQELRALLPEISIIRQLPIE